MEEEALASNYSTSLVPSCPSISRWEGDLVGCGSTNVLWCEVSEAYDCFDCGLFFDSEQAFHNQMIASPGEI